MAGSSQTGSDSQRATVPRMADPDDWFADVEPAPRPRREVPVQRDDAAPTRENVADDWGASEDPEPAEGLLETLSEWRVVIGLVVLAAAVLVALAVAGVFSTGTPKPAGTTTPPATTAPKTTTGQTTSTQTGTTGTSTGSTTTTGPTTTLKPGDTGTQVTALQQALNGLGYSVGTVDGNYGPSTQAAVAKFQTASKLTADGIFGQQTLAALTSALQGP